MRRQEGLRHLPERFYEYQSSSGGSNADFDERLNRLDYVLKLQVSAAVEEKCELMGFLSPHVVDVKNGKIKSVTFKRSEQTEDGEWIEDPEQLTTIKANFLISAFGSGLYDQDGRN